MVVVVAIYAALWLAVGDCMSVLTYFVCVQI